jgi:hypothetical protein
MVWKCLTSQCLRILLRPGRCGPVLGLNEPCVHSTISSAAQKGASSPARRATGFSVMVMRFLRAPFQGK